MNNAIVVANSPDTQHKALEQFAVNNIELEQLEVLLSQFNIFEAIGAVRQELRHSDFLAFLLNPQQNHGLGDGLAKRLLQKIFLSVDNSELPVPPIAFDAWDLSQTTVHREWRNIDILLVDDVNQLAIIIENKIDSHEREGQLIKYWDTVNERYKGWKIVGLYLTPEGDAPSDERYMRVSYGLICEAIQTLATNRLTTIAADVHALMIHYCQMLGRHIVSESEIAKLCRQIYQKHEEALDLIYEHRPDQQAILREFLEGLVKSEQSLILYDDSTKSYIAFAPKEWEWVPVLYFEFRNVPDSLKLILTIGSGDPAMRGTLHSMVLAQQPPFKVSPILNNKYNRIYSQVVLTSMDYESSSEEIEEKISVEWRKFLTQDLLRIKNALVLEHLRKQPLSEPQAP